MERIVPARLVGALGLVLLAAAPGTGQEVTLHVWAAASTAGPVQTVAGQLERPGRREIRVNLDGTSRLALQIARGAPADVFVSADRQWMDWAVDRGLVDPGTVRTLAANRLVLVAPAGTASPRSRYSGGSAGAAGERLSRVLDDMAPGDRLALAGSQVPAGRYARDALSALGLLDRLRGRIVPGGSVRTVVEWVARGEVKLGMVYASDARDDARLRVVAEVPADLHRSPEILGALTASAHPQARLVLDALAGPAGLRAFAGAGFLPPRPAPAPGGLPEGRPDRISTGSAIRISIQVALLATLLALVPAVALGWLLARRPFPGKTLLSALLLSPMVVPPVVTGFLLLAVLGQGGPAGRLLSDLGIRIPFSFVAAVLAATVVGFPLFVVTVRNAFETVDPQLEEMSATLGARPWRTFRRVSLPLALPGIGAGAVLAFARALGEFGATIVLAGNVEGETRTIALAVYTLLESPRESADVWVLVGASVLVSVLALTGFEYLSRRQRRLVRRNPDG